MIDVRKRLQSFRYAFAGVADLFRSQPNARIHFTVAVAVVLAGIYCHVSRMEWVALVICIVLVLALEAVNTALEYLTDLVSPEYHPLAGKAKDVAAAAVLIAAIGAVWVGILIFMPYLSALFQR
jgi:diacylglycerol kinase